MVNVDLVFFKDPYRHCKCQKLAAQVACHWQSVGALFFKRSSSKEFPHLCIKLELDSLLGHNSLELFADIHVDAQTTNVTKKLDSGNLNIIGCLSNEIQKNWLQKGSSMV